MHQATPAWAPLSEPRFGFLNVLSDVLAGEEQRRFGTFPGLHDAECIFVASDYSGEHAAAVYQTITFLLADLAHCAQWQPLREDFRARYLSDGRRLSYKSLNDRIRRRALQPFFELADTLPGLLITFVVPRRMRSLFQDPSTSAADELLARFSPDVAEKLLRVVHLLALLLAGFSREGQDVLWATDSDSIAADEQRVRSLVNVFARVSSNCLRHSMRHFQLATSKNDQGDRSLEDLLSIPDIAAGALSAVFEATLGRHGPPPRGLFLAAPTNIPRKTSLVMNWFSDNSQPLRRLVLIIDEPSDGLGLRATLMRFHGSNDASL